MFQIAVTLIFNPKINKLLSETGDMQRSHLFWLPCDACNVPAIQSPAGRVPTAGQAAPEVSRRPACRFLVSCPRLYGAVARRKLGRVHPRDYSKQVKPLRNKRLAIFLHHHFSSQLRIFIFLLFENIYFSTNQETKYFFFRETEIVQ